MSAAHCQSIKPSVKGGFNSHISGDRKQGDLFFVQMLSYLSAYNTTPVINPTTQCLFFQINFFSISPIQFLWCSSLIYYFTFDTPEALTPKAQPTKYFSRDSKHKADNETEDSGTISRWNPYEYLYPEIVSKGSFSVGWIDSAFHGDKRNTLSLWDHTTSNPEDVQAANGSFT